MSEDKIMDLIKGKLLMIEKMLKQDDEEGHTSAYEMQFEDFEAIQGLLDLYQKEKELSLKRFKNLVKIQEEKDKNYNKGYFQGRRDERNETDNKIKETIEDYTEKSKHPLVNAQSRREYTFGIRALQELLEERN